MTAIDSPTQAIAVFPAQTFRVVQGANLGDPLSDMEEMMLDDIYQLSPGASRKRLVIAPRDDGTFRIAEGAEAGQPGAMLHLDSALQFMTPDGQMIEALGLVETDAEEMIAAVYLLPLGPMTVEIDYTLVGMNRAAAAVKFAQVASVSFTRGTRITLASGAQVRIEDLKVGDRVLTRDHGGQQVRWIGQSTLRATGSFAPIVIRAGTLNNTGDLVVSPDHRLFVYQRSDALGTGRPDLLIKARHLVNGTTIYVQDGGFVDYFQLLFDHHEIIYAEGIAAESLLVDPRTRAALPPDLLARIDPHLSDHARSEAQGLDVQKSLLDRPDVIDLLRRASTQ